MTCIIASASAASLAGLIGRCQSADFRGPRPDRIHHDDLRAATLRLAHERPEVEVRDDRVRPPQHDVPAVDDLLRIDSGSGPDRGREAGGSDRAADVAIEARCTPSTRTAAGRSRPAESAPARPPSCRAGSLPAPDSSTIACHRDAMSASASSQLTRTNRPSPLAPDRFSGCSTRSGW